MIAGKNRRIYARAVVVVVCFGSFLISLLMAEVLIRHLYPEYVAARSDTSFWQHHRRLGWAHRPGEAGKMLFKDAGGKWNTVPVQINSHGYRDIERSVEPRSGAYRVAVLGDSFVFGFGVRPEHIFTRVVERMQPAFELLNFGVSGYSNDQQLLVFEEEALRFAPDAAIMTIVSNDYLANIKTVSHGYPKPRFEQEESALRLTNIPVPETLNGLSLHRIDRFFRHHSGLYAFVTYRLHIRQWAGRLYRTFVVAEKKREGALSDEQFDREVWKGVDFTRVLIARFLKTCREHGIQPFLLMVPSTPAHTELTPHQRALSEYCSSEPPCGIINPYPDFNAARGELAGLYQADKNHWSAAGHAVVAEKVLETLQPLR